MRVVGIIVLVGCRFGFDVISDASPGTNDANDASSDASCTLGAFTRVGTVAGPVTSGFDEWSGVAFLGETQFMFHRYTTPDSELYVASRQNPGDMFANVTLVMELNTPTEDQWTPVVTEDGLVIAYAQMEAVGALDLRTASRASPTVMFSASSSMSVLNSTSNDYSPWLTADGLRILFSSERTGMNRTYEATRTSRAMPFDPPVMLELGGEARDASLSPDGLEIFFSSSRAGGFGLLDMWTARRPALDQPFGPAAHVPTLSSARDDCAAHLTRDGRGLYLDFDTLTTGGAAADIWYATRTCL